MEEVATEAAVEAEVTAEVDVDADGESGGICQVHIISIVYCVYIK